MNKNTNNTALQVVPAEWKSRYDAAVYNLGNYCEAFSFMGQAVQLGTDTETLGNTLLALHHGFDVLHGEFCTLGNAMGVTDL